MTRSSLFLLIPCAVLLAQQPQENDKGISLSQVERKNKAPVSKELLKVKLPKPVEAKLDAGDKITDEDEKVLIETINKFKQNFFKP